MILSQEKVNEFLKIFENPKSVKIYDNLREKEDLKNASKFIQDYHIYGPPRKKNYDSINRNTTLNSKKNSIFKNSTFRSGQFPSHQEIEIQRSITNLRIGKEQFMKEQNSKKLKRTTFTSNKDNYSTYNPNSTSTYSSELLKNQTLYNNLLNNKTLTSTQYLYPNNNYNYNKKKSYKQKYAYEYSKLKDIPSNPEDVEIKELPPNFTISMVPISSANIGMPIVSNENIVQNIPSQIASQTMNEPPQMIEEINTDIIPNDNLQQKEEPSQEEIQEEPPKEEEKEPEPPEPTGKYIITEFNGPVKLPPNYATDDQDEFKAIQFLNEDLSTWKKQIDKENVKVYSKLYKVKNEKGEENDNIMFRSEITIDYPASEVNRQLHSYDLRKKWEKSLEKGKLLKEEDLGNGVKIQDVYSYIKMPFIFADRDMVTRKTIWEDYQGEKDCCLCQVHSIEHPEYPEKEKPVRAIFNNRGEYVKPIDANSCKLYFTSKFDMKLSAPASMMEGKGSEGQEKWIKEFIKQCGK